MNRRIGLVLALQACTPVERAETPPPTPLATPAPVAQPNAVTPASTPTTAAPAPVAVVPAPTPIPATPTVEPAEESEPESPLVEIAIQPWSIGTLTPEWTLRFEPTEAVGLVLDLQAGVLGRAGDRWVQLGTDGALADIAMSVEPKLPVVGVWPSDAWFVDERFVDYHDGSPDKYLEIRLMKLRDGHRWVPQMYGGSQWFHPGTADWLEPHVSTLSGMLVHTTLTQRDNVGVGPDGMPILVEEPIDMTRVAGRHDAPVLGPHRGAIVEFIETRSGEVYLVSNDAGRWFAQIECVDDECVGANARALPDLGRWEFGRKVARGKHAASIVATNGSREFLLHYRGKSGWLLDELPAGERPASMWASEEGGLWTLTGEHVRWRDTDSVWHEVVLPAGLAAPSVAVNEDRSQIFVSGTIDGAAKIFSSSANAATTP